MASTHQGSSRAWKHLYDSARWQKRRRFQLQLQPLCQRCKEQGKIEAAEVVHHVIPHKGDPTLFHTGELESLCKHCHDGAAQQVERLGFATDIGTDGWPIDPRHPVYK
jgi:5-methylcytosine-specific restriction enzyme A